MGITLTVNYDIGQNDYSQIARAIKDHLTPKLVDADRQRAFHIAEYELAEARARIPDQSKPYEQIRIPTFRWDHGAFLARDIGLIPLEDVDNADKIFDVNRKRYAGPATPGSMRTYCVDIFGKNVINCGDFPMTIRMIEDSNDLGDSLYLLQSWHDKFRKDGEEKMRDAQIEVGLITKDMGPSSQGALVANLPKREEDFQKLITQARQSLNLKLLHWTVQSVRFYNDFFGIPMQKLGYTPARMEAIGDCNFKFFLTPAHVKEIAKYPMIEAEELSRKLSAGIGEFLDLAK
jgi:hypothetical protein